MIRPNIDPIRAALWQHCLECPNMIETEREGGVIVVERGTKKLQSFAFYCAAPGRPYPKKIGSKSSWTGTVPLWCPVYLEQKEEAAE